ncbi:Hypothetical predicted protein [Cloeon dipterum]|nr:Hypothetical predicted protein [Cloeon dipterum]
MSLQAEKLQLNSNMAEKSTTMQHGRTMFEENIIKTGMKCGIPPRRICEVHHLNRLTEKVRTEFLLKLLKTKSLVAIREEEEELKQYLFPATVVFLLTPKLKVIDLTGFFSYCLRENTFNYFGEVICSIAILAPNIEEIHVFGDGRANRIIEVFVRDETTQPILSSLIRLQQLRVLQIEIFTFCLDDLMLLCTNVPSLQFLNVNLYLNSLPNVVEIHKALSNLRVFLYSPVVLACTDFTQTNVQFKKLILENLPNLQIFNCFVQSFTTNYVIQPTYSVRDPRYSGFYKLQHLNLNHGLKWTLPMNFLFPSITHLALDWWDCEHAFHMTKDPLTILRQLSSIQGLELKHFPRDLCCDLLHACSQNLLELHVEQVVNLKFKDVLSVCTKIEKLAYYCTPQEETINFFASLKEIKINLDTISKVNILSAPFLEKVTIFDWTLCEKNSLNWLLTNIEFEMIFKQLHTLVYNMDWKNLKDLDKRHFGTVCEIIKLADRKLPKLAAVQFSLNYYCDYLWLANSLIEERVAVEDIRRIGPLFNTLRNKDQVKWVVDHDLITILTKFYCYSVISDVRTTLIERKMAKTENKVSNWTATLQECSPIFVDQVERIARKLGFSTDFEFEDLSSEQREHFLNQLLKTKCAFFVRDEELELKGFLLPAVTENLFNADLKVLDLTGLLSFCKRSSQGNYLHFKHVIIEVISSVCQNLEELFLFDMFSMNHSRHLKMVMEPELMGSLERFPHLRMIQMESFTFEINPLLKLCAALPTLDYLQINLHIERNQLPTATYLRECLSNLKVFLFYTFYRKWDRLAFRRLCTENLPQLQILWRFVGDFTTNFNIIDTTSPRTSNMRHLNVINGFELTCDMHEKFPFVTHLAIDWAECKTAYEHDKNALKNFPNLTSLEIFYFPPDVCFEILEHYKESLIELETAGAENLNFKQILTCCQKLEKISFQSYDFSVWQQLDSFANLKEIKLDL